MRLSLAAIYCHSSHHSAVGKSTQESADDVTSGGHGMPYLKNPPQMADQRAYLPTAPLRGLVALYPSPLSFLYH